jgi:hypothetical protein
MLSAMLAGAVFAAVNLAPSPAKAGNSLLIRDFVLSHGIRDREPIRKTDSFHVMDGKAFAFARIENTGDPTTMSFVWENDDSIYATIPVTVGSSPG